jgi:hypothetical protein
MRSVIGEAALGGKANREFCLNDVMKSIETDETNERIEVSPVFQ